MSVSSITNRRSVSIERPTITNTVSGGQIRTYAAVYSSIRGTIQHADGSVVEEFGKRSMNVTHTFYTPTLLALQAGDRLVNGSETFIDSAASRALRRSF